MFINFKNRSNGLFYGKYKRVSAINMFKGYGLMTQNRFIEFHKRPRIWQKQMFGNKG